MASILSEIDTTKLLAPTLVIHKPSSQNYDMIISETLGFKIIKHGACVLLNHKLLLSF